ncbi:MAG: hypothetical protein QOF30_3158 [Acidimicrobiaceae bacterium]|jgi:hypothetical protein|nr:hypothetical protein [Acidimicrobiaceae bacterium]
MTVTAELSDDREYVERVGEAVWFGSGMRIRSMHSAKRS